MLKRYARLATLTSLLGLLVVPAAYASMQDMPIDAQIGPPVAVVAPPPAPASPIRHIWQPGYYVWTPYGKRWQPGVWLPWPPGRGRGPSHSERWGHGERWEHGRHDWDHSGSWHR
jgi:hypothetical protein